MSEPEPILGSLENRCLTPTMKLKRAPIEARVAARVESWYRERRALV